VATGSAGYPRRYGRDFWADLLAATPALGQSFDTKMARRFRDHASRIAGDFDWNRFRAIVDVGGGQGTVLAAILTTHPDLHGHLVDLAPTTARAATRFAAAGITDRVSITTGSFFDPLPTGADAYLLSDILHDWDDERAHQILARCWTRRHRPARRTHPRTGRRHRDRPRHARLLRRPRTDHRRTHRTRRRSSPSPHLHHTRHH
jgi:hypothetical protein